MLRVVEPELLDELGPDEPRARQSRRDLRKINRVMGSPAWIKNTLARLVAPGEAVLEIGAGEGDLLRALAPRIEKCAGLDFWPRPPDAPTTLGWHQGDVFAFDAWASYPVVFGNLIFHQFSAEQLARLGARLRPHVRVFVACEPRRGVWFERLFGMLCPLIGANDVTRHDGRISIRAGFLGDELARLMGFAPQEWTCAVQLTPLGAYHFTAVKKRR